MTIPRIFPKLATQHWFDESNPAQDWHVLLIIFCIVTGLLAFVAASDYQHIASVLQTVPVATSPLTTPQQLDTKTVLDTRAAEQEKYRQRTYTYTDPSLY